MRFRTVSLSLLAAFVWNASAVHGGDKGAFFNGRDLTGWVGLDDYWSVKEGAIVGSAPKGLKFNTFLCSKKKYRDFELKFQVKLTGKGANSGVQIRSAVFDLEHLAVMGPQCDMGQIFWGSLYGEHYGGMMKQAPKEVVAKVLKENDFNDYHIRCVGNHVTIKLNGETTVDGDFKMPSEGLICWQLHSGGPMEVVFRNIEFKEIKGEKKKKEVSEKFDLVKGTVTLDGQPLGNVIVNLHYDDPNRKIMRSGVVEKDGKFVVVVDAPVGRYKVTITPVTREGNKAKSLIPSRYSDLKTTLLVVEIKEGTNTINFDLKSR